MFPRSRLEVWEEDPSKGEGWFSAQDLTVMVGFGILVEGVLVRVPYKVILLGKEDLRQSR